MSTMDFIRNNAGKCATCEHEKPLDMMLRKDYEKGVYECVDCKVDKEAYRLENTYGQALFGGRIKSEVERISKLKLLFKWVFG